MISCAECGYVPHDPNCVNFHYPDKPSPGYHIASIPKGKLGELSKILEEVHEAIDAEEQSNPIMVLVELSDVYGAIEEYLAAHHPNITMANLVAMAAATKRAFISGNRK